MLDSPKRLVPGVPSLASFMINKMIPTKGTRKIKKKPNDVSASCKRLLTIAKEGIKTARLQARDKRLKKPKLQSPT